VTLGCYFLYNLITFDVPKNRVTWCCKQTEGNTLSSFNPHEYYNDPVLTDIRESLKNNIKHKICDICWKAEANGLTSWRLTEEGLIPPHIKNIDDFKTQVTRLEIKLDNTCDLACIYCGPWDSTTWQKEHKKHKFHNYEIDDLQLNLQDKIINTIKTIGQYNKTLEIGFVGGEPFLSKHLKDGKFKKFVDAYFATAGVAASLTLKFVTNANTPTKILSKTLKTLEQTKRQYPNLNIHVALSLESTKQYTEVSRFGSTWDHVDTNIRTWLSYNWINITINTAFNSLTLADLPNFIDYLKDVFAHRKISISPNIVYWPVGLTPSVLPVEYQTIINVAIEKLSTMQNMFVDDNDCGYDRFMRTLIDIKTSLGTTPQYLVDYQRHIDYITKIRKMEIPNG